MTLNLLKTDISEFFEQVELCKKNWPNAITWLEWWVYTDAGKILFPALSTVKCVLHKFPFLESSETSKIIPKSKILFIFNSYYITYFYLYYTNLLFIYIYIILHNIISIFIIHILRKFEILIFER